MLREILQGLVAQTAAPDGGPSLIGSLVPFALIFLVMYFLIIRPQQKQAKQQQQFISQLKKGDDVVLQGGLFAKVFSVSDAEVTVELAPNVKVRVLKGSVAGPAPGSQTAASTEKKA